MHEKLANGDLTLFETDLKPTGNLDADGRGTTNTRLNAIKAAHKAGVDKALLPDISTPEGKKQPLSAGLTVIKAHAHLMGRTSPARHVFMLLMQRAAMDAAEDGGKVCIVPFLDTENKTLHYVLHEPEAKAALKRVTERVRACHAPPRPSPAPPLLSTPVGTFPPGAVVDGGQGARVPRRDQLPQADRPPCRRSVCGGARVRRGALPHGRERARLDYVLRPGAD